MSQAFKVCPICKTPNHTSASMCSTCGTSLNDVKVVTRLTNATNTPQYDFRYGEDDLLESADSRSARLAISMIILLTLTLLGTGVFFLLNAPQSDQATLGENITDTPRPTLNIATVTLGPPTATQTFTPEPTFTPTITNTPAPCVQRIGDGGSLIGAITACGHRSLDVMPTVMALNNLSNASQVRLGQDIIVPWPTPTIDPNITPTETPTRSSDSSNNPSPENSLLSLDTSISAFAPTPTPTLPAGLQWHTVQQNDNITVISLQYNANAKILSELNPEIDFAKCEFGERFGGPECLVQLSIGQKMRVPAPTPTPTLSPTPDPNATHTPTPTPTYNRPNVVSPPDKQFFGANELISLRWIPSATLQNGEAYRVDVLDVTTNIAYRAFTQEIFFLLPLEWQGKINERHEYRWTVGIVRQDNPELITFQTEPRSFVWQGLPESNNP